MLRKLLGLLVTAFCAIPTSQASSLQFVARKDIATDATSISGVAVADFNGDGVPDIAVFDTVTKAVTVLLNDGVGTFKMSPSSSIVADPGLDFDPSSLLVGDLNSDGKQDLIVLPVRSYRGAYVLLGKGDGTFTQGNSIPDLIVPKHAVLADVNGDQHLDLIALNQYGLTLALGDGTGNFNLQTQSGVHALDDALAIADFNGDGHLDLVFESAEARINFLSGTSEAVFSTPGILSFPPISRCNRLSAADMNGDGKLDLLIAGCYAATINFGNGDGSFIANTQAGVLLPLPYMPTNGPVDVNLFSPVLLSTADMDHSGTTDVVAADDNVHLLSVLLNDGTGAFKQVIPDFSAPLDPGTSDLEVADLNGDGLPDIVVTNYKTQKISIFLSVVQKATPTITLQSSAAQVLAGGSVTLTVQVKGSSAHMPTGTVTLTGSDKTSYGQQTLDATGQATFSLNNLAVGQYSLTATYSGDSNNTAANNSTAFAVAVTDVSLSVPTPSQTVAVGASATYSVSLSPDAGFTGAVNLTCSGLPAGYTCQPVSVTVKGQNTTANVVVSPPATTAALHLSRRPGKSGAILFASTCVSLLFFKRRKIVPIVACIALSCAGAALSGCSSSGSAKPPAYTGTSNFLIIATVTQGSQTVSHQTTATLTVK